MTDQVINKGVDLQFEHKLLLQSKELLQEEIQHMNEKLRMKDTEHMKKLDQQKDLWELKVNELLESNKTLQLYIEKQEIHIHELQRSRGGEDSEVIFNFSHSLQPFIDRVDTLQQEKIRLKEETLYLENKYCKSESLYQELKKKLERDFVSRMDFELLEKQKALLEKEFAVKKNQYLQSRSILTEHNGSLTSPYKNATPDKSKENIENFQNLKSEIRVLKNKLCDVENKYTTLMYTPPKVKIRTDDETEHKLYDTKVELLRVQQELQTTKRKSETKILDLEEKLRSSEVNYGKIDEENKHMKLKIDSLLVKEKEVTLLQSKNINLQEKIDELQSQLKSSSSTSQVLDAIKERFHKQCSQQVSNVTLKRVLTSLLQLSKDLRKEKELISEDIMSMRKQFPDICQSTKLKLLGSVENVNANYLNLAERYTKEMKLRKQLHNELVEIKGNIRVLCRVRPLIKEDGQQPSTSITCDNTENEKLIVNGKGSPKEFCLDRVFQPQITQEEVFGDVQSLIQSCLDGYNVCIFAYGQTGSGKTFTMEGPDKNPGINRRALDLLFNRTQEQVDWEFSVFVTYLEIYNETLRDLLSTDGSVKLEIKQSLKDVIINIPGLTCVPVKSPKDVNDILKLGKHNRKTASTNMNEHSSRSHTILGITLLGENKITGASINGKLNLVDLAGSERVSRSGASGVRMKEAQSINKSLSALGDVIHALKNKKDHIPYRNSKLTYLLKDSLSGDSKTLMVVQVSPLTSDVSETLCTLNFAQRVQAVELKRVKKK